MDKYTDFLIRIGGEEIVFRHSALSVKEFMELEQEFIYDFYGFQGIKKSEIQSLQLAPGPYVHIFFRQHGRTHRDLSELWGWVATEGIKR